MDFKKFVEDFSRWSRSMGGKEGAPSTVAGRHVTGPIKGSSVVVLPEGRDPLPVMRAMLARIEELETLHQGPSYEDILEAHLREVSPDPPSTGKNAILTGGLELD